jgi:hypothetical protein
VVYFRLRAVAEIYMVGVFATEQKGYGEKEYGGFEHT